MAALYSDVTVAADEHLAGTGGEMLEPVGAGFALLGRRADGLADLERLGSGSGQLLLEGA